MADKNTKVETFLNTNDKTRAKDDKSLPSKFFATRDSLLTNLFKNEHIQMMYNLSMVIYLGILWSNFLTDYLRHGEFNLGQKYVFRAFGKWHVVLYIWIIMFLSSMLTFPSFRLWARVRLSMQPKSSAQRIWDNAWIFLTITFYFGLQLYLPAKLMVKGNLPIISRVVVLAESIRFLMKSHAFIRSNASKVLAFKSHSEQTSPIPAMSSFFYFWFAPTLIYQDEYPRTKEIRWNFVLKCFLEFLLGIFFAGMISDFFIRPLEKFCVASTSWNDIVILIFQNALYGLLLTLIFFYLFLHCWLNAFAEMLKFGDRLFYKDFWTSTSYPRFYRTWNSVVHDWLYAYILKDSYEYLFPKNKAMSRILVLVVSAIFHEYVLCFLIDGFFPVFLFYYIVPSLVFWMLGEKMHWTANWGVLYCQGLGISIFITIYTAEYNARQVCEPLDDAFLNYVTPALIRCKCFS